MTLNPLLVDTNVLLRIAQFGDQRDEQLLSAIEIMRADHMLCVAIQNVAEFWNVATRAQKYNGLGRTIREAARETDSISQRFLVLPETEKTFVRWRILVEQYEVTGVLVHDARLAALMAEYQIHDLLTLNPKDFNRFPFITVLDPRERN